VISLLVITDVSDEHMSTCNEDRSDGAPSVDQSEYRDEEHDQQSASVADVELKDMMHYQSFEYHHSTANGNVYEVIRA